MRKAACLMLVLGAVCSVAMADPVTLVPTEPVAGQNLTITYDPTCTPLEGEQTVYLRYGFNGFSPTIDPDPLVTSNGAPYVVTVPVPSQATEINIAFRNDADPQVFDNNDGDNYDFAVTNGLPNPTNLTTVPSPVQAGTTVTITYDPAGGPLDGVSPVYMHFGFNYWNPTNDTDVLMTSNGAVWEATVDVKSYASIMDISFNDTGNPADLGTVWDNNDDFDWHLPVTGTIEGVSISPNPPVANQPVTIQFNPEDSIINTSTTGEVYIHWGINDFPAPYAADIQATWTGTVWEGTIPSVPVRAERLQFVFKDTPDIQDGITVWDSNGGNNWVYFVDGAKPLTNELDLLYVAKGTESAFGTPALILGIGGNLADNGSAFAIFIDTPTMTGQTELRAASASGASGAILAASRPNDLLSCSTVGEGTILPGEADYALVANRSGQSLFFNQYFLSGTPLVGEERACCGGGSLDSYASQVYVGATDVGDGNTILEDDQAFYYEGGFNDSDTNGTAGVSTSGLEIVIPYFNIGSGSLGNGQPISIFVGLLPNQFGTTGRFSNQMLPPNTGALCNPPELLPLRSDLTGFTTVWSGNTGALPTFSGTADGIIVPADYSGSADETQTCPAAEMVSDDTVTYDAAIIHGSTVGFTYISTNGPLDGAATINMQYSYDGGGFSTIAMTADPCVADAWTATLVIESVGLPLELALKFDDGAATEDDNTGEYWLIDIGRATSGDVVTTLPDPPVSGQMVTITYDPTGRNTEGGTGMQMHWGINGWSSVQDTPMTETMDCKWEVTVQLSSLTTQLDMVFFNAEGTWDNNDGADWHLPVNFVGTPPPWEATDGELDCCATLIGTSTNGLRHMYAGMKDGWVYVAVESTMGYANDHFILITTNGSPIPQGSPWGKAGTAAQWDGFLAQESTNSWVGWFDGVSGFNTTPNDTTAPYLEGSFELGSTFPSLPSTIYLAHAAYLTADGAALAPAFQVPQGNGDGNIDANEYIAVDLAALEAGLAYADADLNESCTVDEADVDLLVECLDGPGLPPAGTCGAGIDADFDNDGDVDLADFATLIQSTAGCPVP